MRVRQLRNTANRVESSPTQPPLTPATELKMVDTLLGPAFSINLASDLPSPKTESRKARAFWFIYEFGLFISSELMDSLMIQWGLENFQRPLQWYLPIRPEITYPVSGIYLCQDVYVNRAYFRENFDTWKTIFNTRMLPVEWDTLTRCEEIIAGILWATLSLYYAMTLGCVAIQLLRDSDHENLAIAGGVIYANASLVATIKDWENMRKRIRDIHRCEKIKCNITLASLIGWLLALNSASSVAIMCFDATVSVFEIDDNLTKLFLLGTTILASASTISAYASNNTSVIRDFFSELRKAHYCPSSSKIFFFLAAAYFTSIIMDSCDPIYSEKYDEELLPYINIDETTANVLGFMGAFSQTLGITVGMYSLLDTAYQKISSLFTCCRRKPPELPAEEKTLPTVYREKNKNTLFQEKKAETFVGLEISSPPNMEIKELEAPLLPPLQIEDEPIEQHKSSSWCTIM